MVPGSVAHISTRRRVGSGVESSRSRQSSRTLWASCTRSRKQKMPPGLPIGRDEGPTHWPGAGRERAGTKCTTCLWPRMRGSSTRRRVGTDGPPPRCALVSCESFVTLALLSPSSWEHWWDSNCCRWASSHGRASHCSFNSVGVSGSWSASPSFSLWPHGDTENRRPPSAQRHDATVGFRALMDQTSMPRSERMASARFSQPRLTASQSMGITSVLQRRQGCPTQLSGLVPLVLLRVPSGQVTSNHEASVRFAPLRFAPVRFTVCNAA